MAAGDLGRAAAVDVAQRASATQAAEWADRATHPASAGDAGQEKPEAEPADFWSDREVRRAADDFNRAFTLFDIQAKFSVHEASGSIIVDVIDTRTGDVIREIPPRELLDRWAQMMDIMGLFVDNRA